MAARAKYEAGIERLVKQSRAAGGKRADGTIRDGLRVRVTASGEGEPRILLWWRAPALTPNGPRAYVELGEHPAISIDEAMAKLAAERTKYKRLQAGLPPVAEAPRATSDLTLSKLVDSYVEKVLARKLRDTTDARALLSRNIVKRLDDTPAAFVSPADAKRVVREIRDEGHHVTAEKVRQSAKAMFAWAVREDLLPSNPFRDLTAASFDLDTTPAPPPDITPDDLGAMWRLFHEPPPKGQERSAVSRLGLLVVLATLRRQGELVKSRKEWFDLDAGTWRVPPEVRKMSKKQEARAKDAIVPLPTQAVAALRRMFALSPSSPWAMATPLDSKTGHVERKTMERTLRKLQRSKALDLSVYLSPHKLRHAFSTLANEREWAEPHVIELALEHTLGSKVAATYNRAVYVEQRRRLLQRWADYLDGLAGIGTAGVVNLDARRA